MHKNNFIIYDFFKKWHYDKNGKDLFIYKGVPFGFSLRLEIWNDFVYYIRLYLCLGLIKNINFNKFFCISSSKTVKQVLNSLSLDYELIEHINDNDSFYFPIEKWMDEKIRPSGFRAFLYKIREVITYSYGYIMPIVDSLFFKKKLKTIYIQEYHPTKEILKKLRKDKKIKILLSNFSRNSSFRNKLNERLIPVYGSHSKYKNDSEIILKNFINKKFNKLILLNDSDISSEIYNIFEKRIEKSLPNILRTLDSSIKFLNKNDIDLEILIANIGHATTLLDCVLKHKNIRSYLIINGLLGPAYGDDSKYASVINSYSESIKKYYFKGMENIVVLGDPRMDMYPADNKNIINRKEPTITIGASGFNSVDLNSYVAVEFDFMYDILSVFKDITEKSNINLNLIIKVRGNGYKKQYISFVEKYFPLLQVRIEDTISMKKVLQETDFYISIYSQTLFEASCLGIPALYYKKDNEIKDTPFDNNSELVTVNTKDELKVAFDDFLNNDSRYDDFLKRSVMEKYIGPLDGKNLERNIDYIYKLLEEDDIQC